MNINELDYNNINEFIEGVNIINNNNEICKLNFSRYHNLENNLKNEVYSFYNNGFILLNEYGNYIFNKIHSLDLTFNNKKIILRTFLKYVNFHNYIIMGLRLDLNDLVNNFNIIL